ncbi:B12-binding domain-containing radical SAM protein [Candidatus Parcubacteria bacterium]|nr:B12-binding domain-containing radical SAM protein [Candidatus Parcubacteria bacterium]
MKAKVLLVYPPTQLARREARRPDGSLGLLYLAGALEAQGIETDILDANVGTLEDKLEDTFDKLVMQENGLIRIGMSIERLSDVIAHGGYNVVGVNSNFTPQTRMALEVIQAAKAVSPEILVIAGGINARALAGRFLAAGADAVCNTEGERVIVELVRAWDRGENLAVSGTMTLKEGKIVNRFPAPTDTLTDLDGLPFPTWWKLPWEHYDRIEAAGGRSFLRDPERSAALMMSRGCPFVCDFCHISFEKQFPEETGGIGKLRFKSESRVLSELEMLKSLRVGKVYLEDDSLLANKPRMKKILIEVRKMGLKLADVNGVNLVHFLKGSKGGPPVIDVEFLELLYQAGLTQIVFPVESASQRILDRYATGKLNHDKLDVLELVRIARGIGITCPVNMMIGFPDETEEEIQSSIELGKRLVEAGAEYCSFKIPVPLPGNRLHDFALQKGYLRPDFDPDLFNWRNAVMQNTTVPPERIEELQLEAEYGVNSEEYRRNRLEIEIGTRWEGGKKK